MPIYQEVVYNILANVYTMDYRNAVENILDSVKLLTVDTKQAELLFNESGVKVNNQLIFIGFDGCPEKCLVELMDKLSVMPVLKISAKRILKSKGIDL